MEIHTYRPNDFLENFRPNILNVSMEELTEQRNRYLPAEWYPQSGVQLTWPHAETDWKHMLREVQECFVNIAMAISQRELLLIVAPDIEEVKNQVKDKVNLKNVRFFECDTNDTWARDHGVITLNSTQGPILLDFCFNGWGMKFAANYDNQISRKLIKEKMLNGIYENHLDYVLEGGSIESDGEGTLLTTAECLLSLNRNEILSRAEVENYLCKTFVAQRVLWLNHGYLAGDDTDSHVDTLARLCPNNTIVYVQCTDQSDEHYEELNLMEEELKSFKTIQGVPYRLLPLPMADAIIDDYERLPATYANFLILNGAVLYPTYNQPNNDRRAKEVLCEAFPDYEIIGIDCRALIKQHGSLHCVTMQFPLNVLK